MILRAARSYCRKRGQDEIPRLAILRGGAFATTAVALVCVLCGAIAILNPGGWNIPALPGIAAATQSATLAPAPAAVSTAPRLSIPTRMPGIPAPIFSTLLRGVLFHDDFSSKEMSAANGWRFGSDANFDVAWSPNQLSLAIKQSANYAQRFQRTFKDGGIEIEAQPLAEAVTYGISFRSSGEEKQNEYLFFVTTDGFFFLYKRVDGQAIKPPLAEGPSPYLNKGLVKNRLGVLAEGATISLFINGHLVHTLNDDSLRSGVIAAYVGAGTGRTSVAFTRVTVYTLEKAKTELGARPEVITPAPRPTIAPTTSAPRPPAIATSTPRAIATYPPGILFHDDFSSESVSRSKGWGFGAAASADYLWSPHKFTITTKKKRTILWATVPAGAQTNFGVEVEAQPENKPGVEYGLMLRLSGSADARSYYLFGVTTEGKYYLYKKIAGEWVDKDPVSPTASPFIQSGAGKNRLGGLMEGTKISLYLNGNLVKTLSDDSMASGSVAVFVNSRETERASVAFSRVILYTVEKAKIELGKR